MGKGKTSVDGKKLLDGFKVSRKSALKRPASSVEIVKPEIVVSKYDQTTKGRWIERNLHTLSKSFQQAWQMTKEKKDKIGKSKLLSTVVKDGKRNFSITTNEDMLEEVITEIRSKSMSSATKAYGKTLMIQKCGGLPQFQEALQNGEVMEVPGPAESKYPYYAFKVFQLKEKVEVEDKAKARLSSKSLTKAQMHEVESKLRGTDFFFENVKGKKDQGWTNEAQQAVNKAIQQGQSLVTQALGMIKRDGAAETNQLHQTAEGDLKNGVKNMQGLINNMQNTLVDGGTMEEGKIMVSEFVDKSQDWTS